MALNLPSGIYRIKNAKTGTYLMGSADEPNAVCAWESLPDHEYQKWDLILVGGTNEEATYHLRNRGDARFLSITASSNATICKALENPTRWVLSDPKLTGEYYIVVEGSGTIVNLHHGNPCNGALVNTGCKCDELLDRRWRFKRIGGQSANRANLDEVPSGRQAQHILHSNAEYVRDTQANRYVGLVPLATYSIYSVSDGGTLTPPPLGSPEWIVQSGKHGYQLRHNLTGLFLGHDAEASEICAASQPSEWLITPSRNVRGYCIHPVMDPRKFIQNGGGSCLLHAENECANNTHVWKLELANM